MRIYRTDEFAEISVCEKADQKVLDICRKRVEDHIRRVKYFYMVMASEGFIPEKNLNVGEVMRHDRDKLLKPNLERQALRFSDNGKVSEKDLEKIDDVVREHIKSNRHHCEYWGEGDHNTKGMDCTAMPDKYIYEMAADWFATAEEKGTPVIDWYEKNVGTRWIFSEHQKDLILSCISYLDEYYDKSMKRDYGLKYIDPATVRTR